MNLLSLILTDNATKTKYDNIINEAENNAGASLTKSGKAKKGKRDKAAAEAAAMFA